METKQLYQIQEVEIHYKRPVEFTFKKINCSFEAATCFRDFANDNKIDLKEFFWVLLLDNANNVLGISEVSIGSSSKTIVNVKEIIQLAIKANASGVIVAHNHPTGTLNPSKCDIEITNRIKEGLMYSDVKLLDHIILTSQSYSSFTDEGKL